MAEFEIKVNGLKAAVSAEETVIKNLQREMEGLERVISASVLKRAGYDDVLRSLRETAAQLETEKNGAEALKKCLSETISFYEKAEDAISGNAAAIKQIEQSRTKLEKMLDDLIKAEKYGENDESSEMSEDPVNLSTGNFIYDHVDLKISGGISLSFKRFYNALDSRTGVLGIRFLHNYEIHLQENESGVTVCMGDGQRKNFRKTGDGNYLGERAALETLEKRENGNLQSAYLLCSAEGQNYFFDREGVLLRQEDRNQRGISFIYGEEKKLLQRAESDDGSCLFYQYDEQDRLICVSDGTGRSVLLSYEGNLLIRAQMADGGSLSYGYTEDGHLSEIRNGNQITVLKNQYLEDCRICRQEFPDGSSMSFSYDDEMHKTTLVERNGSKIIYVQDERYRNTDILYEDGTAEHFVYNEKNQKVKAVDRNGNTCRMAYDSRGNLTQLLYDTGLKINYTYDGKQRLLCLKVNGKEKLHNTYDAKGNLLTAVSADGVKSKMTYDRMGRPVRIEEAGENVTLLSYDERGNITRLTDALGNETGYQYDEQGRVTATMDANGNQTMYEYDAADRLIRIIDPLGAERTYRYTKTGKVAEMTDFDGYVQRVAYNCLDKVERYTDKEGNETCFTYDRMWNVASKKTPDGAVVEYRYDADNRMTQVSLQGEGTITYEYDGNGNRIAETDPEGNRTAYTYDAQNRKTAVLYADGTATSYFYDEDGNLAILCDALGNETVYSYDEMGRRSGKRDALGNTTTYSYYAGEKIAAITYPNGSKRSYEYDVAGRLKKVTEPDGTSRIFSYDKVGNLIEETDGPGQTYRYEYDALNRPVTIVEPNGARRRFAYDALGRIAKMTDEKGNETGYVYSPNGNLLQVRDALGNEVRYAYDCMNRLIKVERVGEPGASQITVYEWNKAGRMISMTDPLGCRERYSYNRNGALETRTDRDGFVTSYTYDAVGNLTNILYGDGRETQFSYNALHRLEEVRDWLGNTRIELDALGRPLSVTDHLGRKVQYLWGKERKQTDLIYPDGTRIHYDYDEAGRLRALSEGTHVTAYGYGEDGRLSEKILPNGIRTTYQYNELGRLACLMHRGPQLAETYRFAYDENGNTISKIREVEGKVDEDESFRYQYDALNQLIRVSRRNQVIRSYSYDAFGNRIARQDCAGETRTDTSYRYNANNQLILEEGNDTLGTREYCYDGRGNLTGVRQDGQWNQKFLFDETNRLRTVLEVSDGNLKAVRYDYNGIGQRVGEEIYSVDAPEDMDTWDGRQLAGQQPEQKLHDLLDVTRAYHNLLERADSVSGKRKRFFWDAQVLAMQEEGEEHFYLQDAKGSVLHLTDAAGRMLEHYGYDEFGVPTQGNFSAAGQFFGFAGCQMEAAGGMYFVQARSYDAHAGRFISEDSVRGMVMSPFTLNHYGYCWNRPLDFVDLDGRFPTWDEVKDFWNTYIYGTETSVSNTVGDKNGWAYWGTTSKNTVPSDVHTGKFLKYATSVNDGQLSRDVSINRQSYDAGDGWKWGIPFSLGVSWGNDGCGINGSLGVDLGPLHAEIPLEIGFSWEDLISLDGSVNIGWKKDTVGFDVGVGLNPFSNIKLGVHHARENGNVTTTSKAGVYMKTGYVYAVVVAGYYLYSISEGAMDPSMAWNSFLQYINSLGSGVCPLK